MSSNWLLSRLSRADARLLQPHLKAVDLPVRRQLEARKKRVEDVYFLETGLASVVANGGHPMEVGMIGREGMTGLSIVLDGDYRTIHETFIRSAAAANASGPASCARRSTPARRYTKCSCALRTLLSSRLRRQRSPTGAARSRSGWHDGC